MEAIEFRVGLTDVLPEFCLASTLRFYLAAMAYLEQASIFLWNLCTCNSSLLILSKYCTSLLFFPLPLPPSSCSCQLLTQTFFFVFWWAAATSGNVPGRWQGFGGGFVSLWKHVVQVRISVLHDSAKDMSLRLSCESAPLHRAWQWLALYCSDWMLLIQL